MALYLIFAVSCKQENGIMCTEEFRSLTVNIVDSSNNPVALDDYYVQNNLTKEIIRWQEQDPFWDSLSISQGNYLLVSDLEMNWTQHKKISITFFGFLDSLNVIKENYIVSDDSCHIYLVSGRHNIILKK